jgi:hypothetical protein
MFYIGGSGLVETYDHASDYAIFRAHAKQDNARTAVQSLDLYDRTHIGQYCAM